MRELRLDGPYSDPEMAGVEIQGITSERSRRCWRLGRPYRPMQRISSPAKPCWRCCHEFEQTPPLCNDPRLRVSGCRHPRLCLPLPRTAAASARQRLGRTHRVPGDCLRSIYAPRPELGALACARLDGIPCHPERLRRGPRVRHPFSVLCRDRLVSFSSRVWAVFSQYSKWTHMNTD